VRLDNVPNVGWVPFFLRVERKKQNKFPSNLHCPVKKLNPVYFQLKDIVSTWLSVALTLVANGGHMSSGGFRSESLSTEAETTIELLHLATHKPRHYLYAVLGVRRFGYYIFCFHVNDNFQLKVSLPITVIFLTSK